MQMINLNPQVVLTKITINILEPHLRIFSATPKSKFGIIEEPLQKEDYIVCSQQAKAQSSTPLISKTDINGKKNGEKTT